MHHTPFLHHDLHFTFRPCYVKGSLLPALAKTGTGRGKKSWGAESSNMNVNPRGWCAGTQVFETVLTRELKNGLFISIPRMTEQMRTLSDAAQQNALVRRLWWRDGSTKCVIDTEITVHVPFPTNSQCCFWRTFEDHNWNFPDLDQLSQLPNLEYN